MSGTLANLPLTQRLDQFGDLLSGGKLYLYEAGTTVAVTAYRDINLTAGQEHPWPILLGSDGLIPQFWLANDDGELYRARLTDASGGYVQFNADFLQPIGATSGEGEGDTFTVITWDTGDVDWQPRSGTRSGWVRCNARTIGSASSGASERANADAEELFTFLWNTYSNTVCPVSTGRGANAAADWAANKTITLLDLRRRVAIGLDDMGNTALAGLDASFATPTVAASTGGAPTITLTTAQIPAHAHTGTTGTGDAHTHNYNAYGATTDVQDGTDIIVPLASSIAATATTGNTHTHPFTSDNTGGGTAHNNMPPGMLGTWYMRL